ncbi:MAG: hypothetical protein JWN34_5212 [Bryobacterales bacterium]|jgi:hypothetical protein|nr:hypothetical protein [Bryobacterales bacterium]
MQELINSIVRLSAAATMYGMQQVQTTVGGFDTKESLDNLRSVIDGVTATLTAKLDENKKSTVDSISNAGNEVVSRTWTVLNVDAMKPKEVADSASDFVRRTSDAFSSMIKSGEPAPAESALAS